MNPVCITSSNVNHALSEALHVIHRNHVVEKSRVGVVARLPVPLITTYLNPRDRVLFSPLRNANPFFHLMEALWMLSGRRDIAWPVQFNRRFNEYSDDGVEQHGAYGHRWRHYFGIDQLTEVRRHLVQSRNSRRAVLQMWDAPGDLGRKGVDVPCNTNAYFEIVDDKLNMTVCCRSNDLIWGAYGANAVHFSCLQEYIAHGIAEVGVYRQFSNNAHVYLDVLPRESMIPLAHDAVAWDQYSLGGAQPTPLMIGGNFERWNHALKDFMENPGGATIDPFFAYTARPMYLAWKHRDSAPEASMSHACSIEAWDWQTACVDWLTRRATKLRQKIKEQRA